MTAVGIDNLPRHCQAESNALVLAGYKRFEKALSDALGWPRSRVRYLDDNQVSFVLRCPAQDLNGDVSARASRLNSISDDIPEQVG